MCFHPFLLKKVCDLHFCKSELQCEMWFLVTSQSLPTCVLTRDSRPVLPRCFLGRKRASQHVGESGTWSVVGDRHDVCGHGGRAGGDMYVRGGRALSQETRMRQLAGNSRGNRDGRGSFRACHRREEEGRSRGFIAFKH